MSKQTEPFFAVRLTRADYDASLPWSIETRALAAMRADRYDHLGGFLYFFRDLETALKFAGATQRGPVEVLRV